MNALRCLILILLPSLYANAFISRGSLKRNAVPSCLSKQENMQLQDKRMFHVRSNSLLKVGSSIQEDHDFLYPEYEPKVLMNRRRAFHNGSTRILTILATALGVSNRIVDSKKFGVEEIFHQSNNSTRLF